MKLINSIIKMAILVFIFSALITSCGDKEGCGNYSKWESKTKFRSK